MNTVPNSASYINQFSRFASLVLLMPTGAILRLIQKQAISPSNSMDQNSQRALLWQLSVGVLIGALVLIVSSQLNSIPALWISLALILITTILIIVAFLSRLTGFTARADRLFAWATLAFAFSSVAVVLLLDWVDFIPDSLWLWAVGGSFLSLLSFSRVPVLFTQIALMLWFYTQFLYGTPLWMGLIPLAVCALVIALSRAWPEQFILLMLNIVIVFNLIAYDAIHGSHFPLMLARDHVLWTLVAVLELAVVGVFLLHLTHRESWHRYGKAALFVASSVYALVLTALGLGTVRQLLAQIPVQAPAGALLMLAMTVLAGLIVCWFARRSERRDSVLLLLILIIIASALVLDAVSSDGITFVLFPALALLASSYACCYMGLLRRSTAVLCAGFSLGVIPLIVRFFVFGAEGRSFELILTAMVLALPLLIVSEDGKHTRRTKTADRAG